MKVTAINSSKQHNQNYLTNCNHGGRNSTNCNNGGRNSMLNEDQTKSTVKKNILTSQKRKHYQYLLSFKSGAVKLKNVGQIVN